jgi:hypothetical protein
MTRQVRSIVRLLGLLFVSALALGTAGAGVASAQTYPAVATLTVDQPVVDPCTTVTLTGNGYLPDATVTVSVNGQVVGTVMTDDDGHFTFPYPVPCNATAGQLLFTAADPANSLTTTVTVRGQAKTTGGDGSSSNGSGNVSNVGTGATGSLPVSGSNTDTYVRIAVLLIAGGGLVLLASRRRERTTVG